MMIHQYFVSFYSTGGRHGWTLIGVDNRIEDATDLFTLLQSIQDFISRTNNISATLTAMPVYVRTVPKGDSLPDDPHLEVTLSR